MPWVTRHLRVGLVLVLLVLLAAIPLEAGAATTVPLTAAGAPKVIITELQTTGKTASEEFVEFYNTTDADIDFADTAHTGKEPWKLQIFSATSAANGAPDWTKPTATVSLNGIVPAHGYFILAGTGYAPGGLDSDQAYNSRLSDTGGGLQLVTTSATQTTYFDRLLWKQAASGQTLPSGFMATPSGNGSLQRQPNEDTEYVNTDGTLVGFTAGDAISPKDFWRAPEPPPIITPVTPSTPESPTDGATDPTTPDPAAGSGSVPVGEPVTNSTVPTNAGLAAPTLSELLPNPAAPLKDETDEFIELYNPNDSAYNLKNYTLEAGTTTLHDFKFTTDVVLPPHGYTAFYAADTRLSLANSGGQARLLDAGGTKLAETAVYDAAADGASWSLASGAWGWSTTPTPNAPNLMTAPVAPVKSVKSTAATTASPKTATTKKAAATAATAKTASAKVKGTTTTKAKAKTTKATKATAKKKTAKTKIAAAAKASSAPTKVPIHPAILVTVVGLAVLYAAYEYRHDIQNRLAKLRRHRAIREYARQ